MAVQFLPQSLSPSEKPHPNHFVRQPKRFRNFSVGVAHCQKAQRITVHRLHLSDQLCQFLNIIRADYCIIRQWGSILCIWNLFQQFFPAFTKHIVCTASTTTNEISGEFVTVLPTNFRNIFCNVQKHLLQYVLCQMRVPRDFVSSMIDQPLVGIIGVYKLFFVAFIFKDS